MSIQHNIPATEATCNFLNELFKYVGEVKESTCKESASDDDQKAITSVSSLLDAMMKLTKGYDDAFGSLGVHLSREDSDTDTVIGGTREIIGAVTQFKNECVLQLSKDTSTTNVVGISMLIKTCDILAKLARDYDRAMAELLASKQK